MLCVIAFTYKSIFEDIYASIWGAIIMWLYNLFYWQETKLFTDFNIYCSLDKHQNKYEKKPLVLSEYTYFIPCDYVWQTYDILQDDERMQNKHTENILKGRLLLARGMKLTYLNDILTFNCDKFNLLNCSSIEYHQILITSIFFFLSVFDVICY